MVLAATNRPMDLDEAIRRRLEKRIHIPLPSEYGRSELFKINLKGLQIDENVVFETLVTKTKGYSGADISNVCRDAALMPMRRKILEGKVNIAELPSMQDQIDIPLTMTDFEQALKNIQPSVSNTHLKEYEEWMKEFGSI